MIDLPAWATCLVMSEAGELRGRYQRDGRGEQGDSSNDKALDTDERDFFVV